MSGAWGWRLGAGLAVVSAALLAMAWVPGGDATPWPLLGLWLAAFGGYAVAATAMTGGAGLPAPGVAAPAGASTTTLRAIWAAAIALRLALLPAAPSLSEDVYRYMWDGWVARNGVNPFLFPPDAAQLAGLHTDWWSMINHPSVRTIYPPAAQIVFLALASIAPAWILFKLAWVAADLAAARLVARLADEVSPGRAPLATLLYLWNPLLIVEVAWSGHFEPLGIAVMLGAVLLVATRPRAGGALLGLGGAIKFAPLAAVPALWRNRGLAPAALALAVPVLLYLPYAGAGGRLFDGLRTYADAWQFNPGLHRILALVPGPDHVARVLGAVVVVVVAAWAAYRRWSPGRALYWTIGAALLVSPTIHPWYVLWALPFACIYGGVGWLVFTGTVTLAYWGRGAYLATGVWPEPAWLVLAIHAPVLLLLGRAALPRPTPPHTPPRTAR